MGGFSILFEENCLFVLAAHLKVKEMVLVEKVIIIIFFASLLQCMSGTKDWIDLALGHQGL